MGGVKKIVQITDWFVDAYNALDKAKRLPSNAALAKIMGMNSKSTVTNILKKEQNIQPEQWKKFKAHFGLKDYAGSSYVSEQLEGGNSKEPKTDSVDYQAKYIQKVEENEAWLKKLIDSSLGKILTNQVDNSVLIGEILQRDFRREAAGNEDVLRKIVGEFLQRNEARLSSDAKADIVAGDGMTGK